MISKENILIIFFLVLFSCSQENKYDDIEILSVIYKNTSKFLPSFSDKKQLGKGISHKYAVNSNYFSEKIEFNIDSYYKDKNRAKVKLDSVDLKIVKKLKENNFEGSINKKQFISLENDLIFLDNKILRNEDEVKYNVNRILTFSKPLYNKEKNRAALYVINYGSELDSSLSIYILHKIENKWVIRFNKNILKS